MGQRNAKADAQSYRAGYPGQDEQEDPEERANVEFYQNKRESTPQGDLIDTIHKPQADGGWRGDYQKLEVHHGYIQWLFPIREPGMNMESVPLTAVEAKIMREDPEVRARIIKSYDLILDFWGCKLRDEETGEVERGENYQKLFKNLNASGHNYLRITRVLKFLGEMGLEHLKAPWMEFMIDETFVKRTIPNCADSLANYWIPVLRDDTERERLLERVHEFVPRPPEDDDVQAAEGARDELRR